MRIVVQARVGAGNADHLQQLHGTLARLLLVHVQVQFERLGDLAPDRQHRVERGHRILEDHGDAVAANLAQLVFAQLEQVLTVKPHFAVHDLAGWLWNQANERHDAHALARAGLAHDRHGLALVDRVRNPIHCMDDAVLREELRFQVLHLEQFGHVNGFSP